MNAYSIVQHAHSGLRWLVLVALLLAIGQAWSSWRSGQDYPGKTRPALLGLVFTHIQLLLGLVLYLGLSPYVRFEGEIMGDTLLRFYTVEHFVGMIIAIAAITVGYVRAKRKAGSPRGYRTIFWYYLIGLVLIIASIPWPFRAGLNGAWF
jgi:hypothetical protein